MARLSPSSIVRLSYINVDTRAMGRGGSGAVLGLKRLKGIAVPGSGQIPVADTARVKEIRRTTIFPPSLVDNTKSGPETGQGYL